MADTICNPNSFRLNFSRMLGEEVFSSVSMPESDLYTPAGLIPQQEGQLSPFVVELLVAILIAADAAHQLHAVFGGSTISLRDGNLLGLPLYAVSIYPQRSVEISTAPTRRDLLAFLVGNRDLLLRPGHAFGSWVNKYTQCHVLDVVVTIRDREAALELGRKFHQQAIFDLANREEIAVAAITTNSTGNEVPARQNVEAIAQ